MSKEQRGKPTKTVKQKLVLPRNNKLKAVIYFSNTKYDTVNINKLDDFFFYHKKRAYNLDLEDVISIKTGNFIFGNTTYIFYYFENNKPLRVSEELSNLKNKELPNDVLYTALKSDAIRKANDIKDNSLFGDLDPKIIIGGGIAMIVAFYFMRGG